MGRLGFVSLLAFLVSACSGENRELSLAVSVEEPAPTVARTIQTFLGERGYPTSINVMTDSTEIFAAIQSGEVDLALVDEPEFPIRGVVTLVPLYPSVLHVLHNKHERVGDFADLIRGAAVYAGPTGGAAYRLLLQLSKDFGVQENQFQILDNPWTVDPDVYFIFGGLLSASSIEQLSGYRLFSFAAQGDVDGASVADGIVLRHHHLETFLLPRSLYQGLGNEAITTLSIRSVLIVREDFETGFAVDIASDLFSNAQDIAMSYPLVTHELTMNLDAAGLILPLHTGTRRYLNRDKPGFVERYVEVLALGVTVIFALLSGGVALYRYRERKRKDRVDIYYVQILEIRKDMALASEAIDLHACHKRAIEVQHEVLNLLIEERVNADASLLAFFSLSNQVLSEIDQHLLIHTRIRV